MLLEVESAWLQVFGRFHIVFLHLPIGLIPAMFVLEFGAMVIRRPPPKGALLTLAVMTALTAAAAFGSGLVLAGEKIDSEMLSLHKNAAIAMAAVSAVLPFLSNMKARMPFRLTLIASLVLSILTGHYGGTLTHKKNFLFKPLDRARQVSPHQPDEIDTGKHGDPTTTSDVPARGKGSDTHDANTGIANPPASRYDIEIAPLMERCCTTCHNPDDLDGDLDLTTRAAILRGWGDELIVTPGKPEGSVMIESLTLPDDDDMRMPPIDEEQLTAKEIATIRKWVLDGCPE